MKYNKYNNIKTIYNGIKYDSKAESRYARNLDLLLKAKAIKSYERQKKFDLYMYGQKICFYKADFVIYHNDGVQEVVDVKGVRTAVFNLKWKMIHAMWSNSVKSGLIKFTIEGGVRGKRKKF